MSTALPIVIIQMGRPPEDVCRQVGEQPDWLQTALTGQAGPFRVIRPFLGEPLPAPTAFRLAIISGSWAMVTDRSDWSEATGRWIRRVVAAGTPLLGICYGHQLMADALGGRVDYHPAGREVGCLPIQLNEQGRLDTLTAFLPQTFSAHLSHEQAVLTPPPGARVLAGSAHDPHQILRYSAQAVSFQFHPEFTSAIQRHCIMRRADHYHRAGVDVQQMLAGIVPTPHTSELLHRLVAGC